MWNAYKDGIFWGQLTADELLWPKIEIGPDGLQRYICTKCGVKYKYISQLKSHIKECGLGATCPFCGFTCTQRRNLPAHMATHSNNRNMTKRRRSKRR